MAKPTSAKPAVARTAAGEGRALAGRIARALDEKVATNVLILDVRGLTPIADFLVLATASSPPHMRALGDAAAEEVEAAGAPLHHIEGREDSSWVLLDCVDVIVHIFREQSRKYYDIERLWADSKKVPWKAPKPRKRVRK